MVKDMRSRMSLFVVSLGHGSIQEGRAAMLMGDIDISMLMVYVQHVQEEKLRDREEYKNKKAKLSLRHHRLVRLRLETESSSVGPPDRAAPKGTTSGAVGGRTRLYALNNRQEHENLPDVVTGMIRVFDLIVYALLDPGVSLSFVTPYVAMNFEIIPEQLS
ncbi:uncharacterized protein [Solanum lycopersicum]|uniref:uncharacterized protein n=1 Tax=Solanum lycopersicum TaxID=4081 RepID=UPI000532C11D|nr:uncharacterized protein LOC101256212 [Solanum lycopersicum]